jgi:hypothetical protein
MFVRPRAAVNHLFDISLAYFESSPAGVILKTDWPKRAQYLIFAHTHDVYWNLYCNCYAVSRRPN